MATEDENLAAAAGEVLRTHDELDRVHEREDRFAMGPDDLPIDAAGWLAWYQNDAQPAYTAWHAAIERLRELTGADFPCRHPWNFRPYCEQLLATTPASPEHTSLSNPKED